MVWVCPRYPDNPGRQWLVSCQESARPRCVIRLQWLAFAQEGGIRPSDQGYGIEQAIGAADLGGWAGTDDGARHIRCCAGERLLGA